MLPGAESFPPGNVSSFPFVSSVFKECTVDDFMDLMWLVKQFGPFFIAVIFFLWRDYRREDRLAARIETLEDEQREVLLPLVDKCSTVIAQNTVVMGRLEKALDR